jgi:hypothetical protein
MWCACVYVCVYLSIYHRILLNHKEEWNYVQPPKLGLIVGNLQGMRLPRESTCVRKGWGASSEWVTSSWRAQHLGEGKSLPIGSTGMSFSHSSLFLLLPEFRS